MAMLRVSSRERANSAEVRRLRAKGILPMALIVKGKGTRLVQAMQKDVRAALRNSHGAPVFDVSIDEEPKPINVVVKDVQRDVISRGIIHLTLQEVKEDDIIRIGVPIIVEGEPDAVNKRRSTMMTPMVTLEVYAKPNDIPKKIVLDASELGDNDKIVVGDVVLPEGVETHVPADTVLVTTSPIRIVEEEVEPEVLYDEEGNVIEPELDAEGKPIVKAEGEEGAATPTEGEAKATTE